MEEENQVFGKNAEAVESNINLESEDFNFYHQNKEEAKKNIDNSSKDLTDFIDSLIQDVPDPSNEEVNSGIGKILENIELEKTNVKSAKTNKGKKVTLRVLFIAALLSILSFSCLCVLGSNHNISIENGFVTFAKDTIKIVFFGETEEEYITIDALLTDLELHGYKDILFPQEFVIKSDEYKVSVPEYRNEAFGEQVSFDVVADELIYTLDLHKIDVKQSEYDYVDINNAKTVVVNDVHVYIFEYNDNLITAELIKGKYRYLIKSTSTYSDMEEIIKSIK